MTPPPHFGLNYYKKLYISEDGRVTCLDLLALDRRVAQSENLKAGPLASLHLLPPTNEMSCMSVMQRVVVMVPQGSK